MDDGPVVPMHPPNTLGQMIKYLFVSSILLAPIIFCHHPSFLVTGLIPAAYWSPDNAWHISIALDLFLFSFPQVL